MLDGSSSRRSALRGIFLASVIVATVAQSGPVFADEATFMAEAETNEALTVTCGNDLRFGVLAVEANNASGTVTVAASGGANATTVATGIHMVGSSGPADCVVANEIGGVATASLSAATGTFADGTLSGVQLSDGLGGTLDADIILSATAGIGNDTLYVGGVLTIPADHTHFGIYTQTITLTVTE